MRDRLVLECTSCEVEGYCPQVIFGEGASLLEAEGGPQSFLLFLGVHSEYPGHWDPQKHHIQLRLGERKLYPSEVKPLLAHIPWLVERIIGFYPEASIRESVVS